MTCDLTPADIQDLEACEEIIKAGKTTFVQVGIAVNEIRERRLYRRDYDTFEAYCQQKWGWNRKRASQLITSASAIQSLPENLSTVVDTERAAREVGKVPAERRAEVIKVAQKSGPVTGPSIKTAAAKVAEKNGSVPTDKTGYPIPDNMLEDWESTEAELKPLLQKLSDVRSHLRKIMEGDGDSAPPWRQVSVNNAMIALDNAYREINAGVPFAVCYYCQGRGCKKCTACKQTGFIGKFAYSMVDKALKAIREKSSK